MYNSEKYRKGALEESTAKGEEGLVLAATAFRAELVRVLTHGGGIHEYLSEKRKLFAEYKKWDVTDSDQEMMTEKERETYANLVGDDDDDYWEHSPISMVIFPWIWYRGLPRGLVRLPWK